MIYISFFMRNDKEFNNRTENAPMWSIYENPYSARNSCIVFFVKSVFNNRQDIFDEMKINNMTRFIIFQYLIRSQYVEKYYDLITGPLWRKYAGDQSYTHTMDRWWGALTFSLFVLICWTNNRFAGESRCQDAQVTSL